MWPKLRFLLGIALVALSFIYSSPTAQAGDEETYFVVTAYYSPLPGQIKYTTGSYAGDIRLNGEWHTTASWKSVFPGLLAGPANYPFGTKIYFEGFWIWSIEDRWWAIVKAGQRWHSYDRIDIWMGYGDEGLQRALTWGSRTIKGKIVVPSASPTISFWESSIGILIKLSVNPESSNPDDVKILQEIFKNAELYSGKIDGEFASIEKELVDFQLKKWLISSRQDDGAGWYGPKTIAALREEYGNNTSTLITEPIENFAIFNHKQASVKYKVILEYGDLQVNPDSQSETVKQLQELLAKLWEYNWNIDGEYSSVESSLIALQKKIWLINDSKDWGAWYFWNKTKTALWSYYEKENIQSKDITSIQEVEVSDMRDYALNEKEKKAINIIVQDLKSQDYYITWNYEDELILNGRGIAWASWKGVFSGMLAAPGKYSFWTKIYLDGLGIWSVEDRGGAIVPAGQRGYSYDRIDVWMGYGDEGLLRANFWGKRKVYGYIVDSGNTTNLNYENIPAPKWATTGLKKQNVVQQDTIPDVFDVSLWRWSNTDSISQMQDIFIELWYELDATWIYSEETINIVYNFQVKENILSWVHELWAWYFGPKTREKLKEVYFEFKEKEKKQEEFLANISDIQEKSDQKAKQYIDSLGNISYGNTSYEVRELQKTLWKLGFFNHKDTAIFWNITKQSLIAYQLDRKIISSQDIIWAWIFWPNTRESLIRDMAVFEFEQYIKDANLEESYDNYISNNTL